MLLDRLLSDEGRQEWITLFPGVVHALLETPLGAVLSPDSLADLLDSLVQPPLVDRVILPALRAGLTRSRAEIASDGRTLDRFVPESARLGMDALAARPGLIPKNLLRQAIESDAVEEIFRDVLYDALKQFSEKVNPLFADWGLPSLLKKVMPLGAGAVMRSLESLKEEIDRRQEPEIRRFLQGFSRRALHRAAEASAQHLGDPKSIALRRHLIRWTLEQPINELIASDEESSRLLHGVIVDLIRHVLLLEEVRDRRRTLLVETLTPLTSGTLQQALDKLSISLDEQGLTRLAEWLWPWVQAIVGSPPVTRWLQGVLSSLPAPSEPG